MKICMLPKKLARSFCYAAIVLMFLIPHQSIANVNCSRLFYGQNNDCTQSTTTNCAWLRTSKHQCKNKIPGVLDNCGNGTKIYQCAQGDAPAPSTGNLINDCSTIKATDCTQYHTSSNACKKSSLVSCNPIQDAVYTYTCETGDECK